MGRFSGNSFTLLGVEALSPVNQLFVGLFILGFAFLLLVTFLDDSEDYELKRDWRKKK